MANKLVTDPISHLFLATMRRRRLSRRCPQEPPPDVVCCKFMGYGVPMQCQVVPIDQCQPPDYPRPYFDNCNQLDGTFNCCPTPFLPIGAIHACCYRPNFSPPNEIVIDVIDVEEVSFGCGNIGSVNGSMVLTRIADTCVWYAEQQVGTVSIPCGNVPGEPLVVPIFKAARFIQGSSTPDGIRLDVWGPVFKVRGSFWSEAGICPECDPFYAYCITNEINMCNPVIAGLCVSMYAVCLDTNDDICRGDSINLYNFDNPECPIGGPVYGSLCNTCGGTATAVRV